MKKSDLLVLHEMAEKNLDVRAATNFVEGKKVKQGALLTMGVEYQALLDIMAGTHIPVIYVMNAKQFFEIKNKEYQPVNPSIDAIEFFKWVDTSTSFIRTSIPGKWVDADADKLTYITIEELYDIYNNAKSE